MNEGLSNFSGVKVIDYRNARYQGFFNSAAEKRQGLGILIDDDMNVYCSEWKEGRMEGMTFVYHNNGTYMYGNWKNNEPNGINILRNKEFIVAAAYLRGNCTQNTLAIADSINYMLVFAGEDVTNRNRNEDVSLVSSENIMEINYYEEILLHTANKNGIGLEKRQASLVNFLTAFAERYPAEIVFKNNREGFYYFGFRKGLGIKFTLHGKVYHKLSMYSIGTHEQERISEYGVKIHEKRCVQEGNFSAKQTITYNIFGQRPRDKCHSIYQKIHKKGLNFINEYFQLKSTSISSMDIFLRDRLSKKYQELLNRDYQMKRSEKRDREVKVDRDREEFYREAREEYAKKTSEFSRSPTKPQLHTLERSKSINNIHRNDAKQPKNTITFNKRRQPERSPPPKANPSPNKYAKQHRHTDHQQKYSPYQHQREGIHQKDEYKQLAEQLYPQSFKKETKCQRCRSKEKKRIKISVEKSPKKQERTSTSKSPNKIQRTNTPKELKYVKTFDQSQQVRGKSPAKRAQANVKSSSSLLNISLPKQTQKQKIRLQNQLRIREELYQKQIQANIKKQIVTNIPSPSHILQEELIFQDKLRALAMNERQYNYSPQYLEEDFSSPIARVNIPYSDPYCFQPLMQQRDYTNKNSQLDNLQERRNRLLREFKQLNVPNHLETPSKIKNDQRLIDNITPISPELMHAYENSMFTELLTSRGRMVEADQENRLRAEQFNRKYRDLLEEDNKLTNKIYREDPYQRRMAELNYLNEPQVASFQYLPTTQDAQLGSANTKDVDSLAQRQRYKYYFDNL